MPDFRSVQNLMSNTNRPIHDSAAPDFLFPLQKRTRNEAVTAQLTELSRLSRSAVLRQAHETDPDRRLARETLVALVRGYERAGDTDAADAVLELLIQRIGPALGRTVSSWAGLTSEDKADAQRQMIVQICEQVGSLHPGAEFWECNFTFCFNKRLITLWRSLTERKVATVSAEIQSHNGETLNRLEQQPHPADALAEIELRDLAALVSGGSAKKAQAILLKTSGFSDEEIAARVGITSRTLRNWITEARAAWLRQRRQEEQIC